MELRLIPFTLCLVCTLSTLLSGGEASSGGEQPFPIVCVLGPPADDNRLEHWQRIKDANFTAVLPSFQYDEAGHMQMLDHCREVSLGGIVHVKALAPNGSAGSPPAGWRETIAEAVERYSEHPALYAYMVRDEPGADLFPQLGRVVEEFERLDPRHPVSINLFPDHATQEQLGTSTYVEHLDLYLRTVKPPFLSYDHYPLLLDGSDRPTFFLNLELARAAGLKYDTPVWTVILSGWVHYFRKPTAAEMRWQVNSALAYGIKGLAYFAYWPVDESYAAVVDYAGRPQPLYEAITEINGRVLELGRALGDATSTAVYHTGETIPEGCRRLPRNTLPLDVPQHLPLLIGLFKSGAGEQFAMIVNRDYRQAVTVPLTFSREVREVAIVAEEEELLEPAAGDGERQCEIPPGDAVLLRLGR